MPRLVHDRVTWLIYAQLGVWGFFLYGFGPVVPLLRDEQGTSAAVAGLHSTGLAAGALVAGLIFPRLVRRIGRGRTLWVAAAGVAGWLAVLCSVRPLPLTLAATVLTAVFGSLLVNGVTTSLSGHHGPAAPAAISEANAACAGMGILAPLVIGLTVGAGFGWRPALAVGVVLIGLVAVAARLFRIRLPEGGKAPRGGRRPRPGRLPRAYWLAWALICCTGSVEICLSLWAADVLREHAGMSPGAASAAVAAIVTGMFIGRLVGGRAALRVAPAPLLLGALALSLAGFALFWVSPVGWLAVGGLVLAGLGNAMHYPLAISMALDAAPGQPDRAVAMTAPAIAIAFGVAPVVLGRIADSVGAHLAFLLVPAFIAGAAVLTVRLRRVLTSQPADPPRPVDQGLVHVE